MSARPSPFTSATPGTSSSTAKKLCHLTPVPTNREPFDSATYTSAAAPRVNVMMSSRPSRLTSPMAGISLPTAKTSCHLTPEPTNEDPVDSATYTSAAAPRVNVAMSSRPSPLKSPTTGISLPTAKKSCHFTPVPTNDEPLDSATYTSAAAPRVNVAMSSRRSPLKSPTTGISSPTAKKSCHFTPVPTKEDPVDSATYTSAAAPRVNVAMSSRPSPLKSPTSGTSRPTAKKSCHFTPVPTNRDPLDSATYTSAAEPRVNVTMSSRPSPLKSPRWLVPDPVLPIAGTCARTHCSSDPAPTREYTPGLF